MSQHASGQGASDYLVRARNVALLPQVITFIERDLSIAIARRLGPPDEPHTLLIAMTEPQVAALQQHFGNHIIVERDQPLSLLQM
jgi:hypothetical protein